MTTLDAIIGGCKDLRSVGDLSQWEGISGPDLGEMRQMAHEQNLQLDLSSHQVLRRFLGLAGGDQRAMMTLMTGPIMERIRLTQVSSNMILFILLNKVRKSFALSGCSSQATGTSSLGEAFFITSAISRREEKPCSTTIQPCSGYHGRKNILYMLC